MLKLYNTLTRKIEEFKPINPPKVGMYSCGPTVYDYPHLGNLRAYVFVDSLKRTLEYNGLKVEHVMNITDVGHLTSDADAGEDKMEVATKREHKDAWEIARFYEKEFLEAFEKLNIGKPNVLSRATEHIEEMVALVKKLEKKGFTYQIEDGIYFDTSKLLDYGKLTNMPRDKILAGARVEVVPGKHHLTDFALWKFTPKGTKRQMEWDSPWGIGFPGWHIECSAMGMKYLGEKFDLHTGGVDHIAIHHTNEIAQNEAATGQQVVNFWVHNEFLLVEGKKMSKSLGNFYNLNDIEEKGFEPLALRYLFLTSHYRTQMNFTWESLGGAQAAYRRLKEMVGQWRINRGRKVISQEDTKKIEKFRQQFLEKISDDLNMPEALTVVWAAAKSNLPDPDKLDLILDFDHVLGLDLERVSSLDSARDKQVPKEVEELIVKREELRKESKWEEADAARKKLEEKGFVIEDTTTGTKLKKKP